MIDKDALLKEAEELRKKAESIKNLDEAVERRSNSGKRRNLVDAIVEMQRKYLNTSQAKVAWQSGTAHAELVKSVNGLLLTDMSNIASLRVLYNGTPNWDTASERRLLLSECFKRVEVLKKGIMEGKLDHLLQSHPGVLIHGVMGYNGELLEELRIDPKLGETYRKITEPDLVPTGSEVPSKDLDDAQRLWDTRLEAFIEKINKAVETSGRRPSVTSPTNVVPAENNLAHKKGKQLKRSGKENLNFPDVRDGIISDNIGLVLYTVNKEIALSMGLGEETRGILVGDFIPNSIAEKAVLRAGTLPAVLNDTKAVLIGDIIKGIEDIPLNNAEELKHYLSFYHLRGTKIKFSVVRNGIPVDVELVY